MLKKTIRRLGALAMVLAMAVSVFAVNASAVNGGAETPTENQLSATLTKTVLKDANVYLPTVTFYFKALNGRPSNDTVAAAPAVADVFKKATTDSAVVAEISFAPGDANTLTEESVSKTANIEIDESKVPVGVFYYGIQEKASNYDGMTDSTEIKTFVIMKDVDGNVTYGFVVKNNDGEWVKSGNNVFTNDYRKNDNTPKGPHDLILKKNVTGNAYNATMTYDFWVTIKNANANAREWYKVVRTGDSSTTEKIVAGEKTKITLAKNESVTIKGLSPNDTYIVEEVDYTTEAYKYSDPTATKKIGDSNAISLTLTKTLADNGGYTFKSNDEKMTAADNTVEVTNEKSFSTPGGVIMTIAPYALMVVLAGAFAVVFLTRRNRAE